jgi:membrane associated rhomboid family serine protease
MGDDQKSKSLGLSPVLAWVALLWLIEAVDVVITQFWYPSFAQDPNNHLSGGYLDALLGIQPLTLKGLLCIPTAPLMHAGWAHLFANSIGLVILGWPSWRYSPKLTMAAVGYATLWGGALAWSLGNVGASEPTCHIGASGIVFGLVGFLIGNGIFRRGCMPLLLGVGTAVLFAGSLPQVLPGHNPAGVLVSWQMHLGGLLGGLSASWHLRKEKQ